ncbi:hypothetical protein G7Z17_g8586 [Cylindrodendrum hubeiense]|uniref:Uncharacterized protein n=1 Tax=Cylindrodendrum hubeiense TaxID=595255 RepID=A0A9P5H3A7_9HYPO|nr:hypothetical protein G7Z17_g8586 [Cylindrodendrum hubeiense]
MMLHGAQPPSAVPATPAVAADAAAEAGDQQQVRLHRRKRKAGTQENERLHKRLSLLNLEKGGNKLYVPVETPASSQASNSASASRSATMPDDTMQLDDSKHKVYIYNIDDELSSDSESSDDGKLVFLPNIEKHLRATRIPPSILANKEGEVAGMEVVLYTDPKSLTVPEGKDSVRKAIIESRRRTREQQRLKRETKDIDATEATPLTNNTTMPSNMTPGGDDDSDAMDVD